MQAADHAKKLRRNMTDAETKMWSLLRDRRLSNLKFRRQVPMGRYIVDFCCLDKKLIIELDGSQHLDQIKYDKDRDRFFIEQGFAVLRFWNHEVFENTEGIIEKIMSCMMTPHPGPLPQGERGCVI
jgi:very-short-patch-repair endonuclease